MAIFVAASATRWRKKSKNVVPGSVVSSSVSACSRRRSNRLTRTACSSAALLGKWRKTVAMPTPARRATSSVDADSPHRRAANITIHETTDPEVIVAEFECQGTVADTGVPFALPGIFVLRVRDGEIVSSRDYFDHLTAARIRGRLDGLVAAVNAAPTTLT
jgi:limonene-1,2-epoxide hydrolase